MLILFFNYEFILRVLCGLKKSLNLGIIKPDEIVKNEISPPLAGADEGEGEIIYWNLSILHPHPDPLPSREREYFSIFPISSNLVNANEAGFKM